MCRCVGEFLSVIVCMYICIMQLEKVGVLQLIDMHLGSGRRYVLGRLTYEYIPKVTLCFSFGSMI